MQMLLETDPRLLAFAAVLLGLVLGLWVGMLRVRARDRTIRRLSEELAQAHARLLQCDRVDEERQALSERTESLIAECAGLKAALENRQQADAQAAWLKAQQDRMEETFRGLSAELLQVNAARLTEAAGKLFGQYLESARNDIRAHETSVTTLVTPIRETLEKYRKELRHLEAARENADGLLSGQIRALSDAQRALQTETGKLAGALKNPQVRGRWGEMTLKRVVELAGMSSHCDFTEQPALAGTAGRKRPDMIVRLPEDRYLVVDAKAPLDAYMAAVEAADPEARETAMQAHARQVESHMKALGRKAYDAFSANSPDFVVMFIPGENFFAAAMSRLPDLLETGAARGVILATPSTLLALLKAVAYGWRGVTAEENARAIQETGAELYERLMAMTGHMNRLGKDIEKCAETYNQVIGSLDRRVLVSARRLEGMGISGSGGSTVQLDGPRDASVRQLNADKDDS